MKVLGICCGRKNGNTEILMKAAFQSIRERCAAECSLVRLQEAKINSCVGCETCVVHRLKGDNEFRCVHKKDSDHFYFIEQLAREADAIVVSAPAYNLMPPGILTRFLNRFHGSGDYGSVVSNTPKVGATFTVGGSNWTNYALTMTNKLTAELTGSYASVVDMCNFDHVPSSGAVVLDEEIMNRIRALGTHIAEAMLAREKGEPVVYRGEPGLCPDCHSPFLEQRGDEWYCPQCMTKAALYMENGKIKAKFTQEERAKNRWSPEGNKAHKDSIRREHERAAQNSEKIELQRRYYAELMDAVPLPELHSN